MIKNNEILKKIGENEDTLGLMKFIDSDELSNKVFEFVNKENIDCKHLWEDGENGIKSAKNLNKLVEFVFNI